MKEIINTLFEMQDIEYRQFQIKLVPTVAPDSVIGIRTPILRKYAKEISKDSESDKFLSVLPHKYFEENNLHAFLIESKKDFNEAVTLIDKFLPYIDNWATCDGMSPPILKHHRDLLIPYIYKWLASSDTYAVRFGILCLMRYYLDDSFEPEYMERVSKIKSDEYYINMMISWYFATALAKQYNDAVSYLENESLPTWVHNKTIQKAVESFRIPKDKKEYLKTLKKRSIQ